MGILMWKTQLLMLLIWGASCSPREASIDNTTRFKEGKRLAELDDSDMEELSGLAASRSNPGLLWAHNDSGNAPEIFLIDTNLEIRQTFELEGVENRDWEDIAVGPGPDSGKFYLYIAEIGDNQAVYPFKHIYRIEEPSRQKGKKKVQIKDFDVITFRLEDGQKDAEALMIDPATRDLFLVSKREDPVYLYQLQYPYSTTDTLVARQVLSIPLTQIVAGDISPDGKEVLLKNYDHIYYWDNSNGKTIPQLLEEPPKEVPYKVEPQGESIAWAENRSGFYTISEQNKGKKTYLYFYKRR